MAASRPVIIVVPGASQSPSHYAYLIHLLQSQGWPTQSALLPSTGTYGKDSTAENDAEFIRTHMLLPVLDFEKHNVILLLHSYSGMPGSAAALGLGKAERASKGKSTAVLGQIFVSAMIPKGGDGQPIISLFGNQMPPHIVVDEAENMLRCPDPKPPLYNDVPKDVAGVAVLSCMNPSLSSWTSPCPPASWDRKDFQGRCAFIRTKKDQCFPYDMQNMIIQGTGQEWILRDIDTGHCPNLSQPEKLLDLIVELAAKFEAM